MSQQPHLLLLLLPSIPWARILHKNPQPKSSFSRTSHLFSPRQMLLPKTTWIFLLQSSSTRAISPSLYQITQGSLRSSRVLSGTLLDKVSDEMKSQMKHHLKDQTVTLIEDGWLNIRNDPVLAITVQKRGDQAVT